MRYTNQTERHYKIRFRQKFMGEILEDSYDKWCTPEELAEAISALYEDPHVFSVGYVEIPIIEDIRS